MLKDYFFKSRFRLGQNIEFVLKDKDDKVKQLFQLNKLGLFLKRLGLALPNLFLFGRYTDSLRVCNLVTNAGMSGVSDPGARIVAACRREGLYITVIPGPSSVTAAMALSGFGGGGYLCQGFLPRKAGARKRRLGEIQAIPVPVVIFESPYRWLTLLAEMQEVFPGRNLFVGRELTKLNEECMWGTVADVLDEFTRRSRPAARAIRGELVVVLAPASKIECRMALPAVAEKKTKGKIL